MIGDSNNQTERIGASGLLIADINRRETLKEMTYLDIVVAFDKTVGGMNSLLNYNFHLKSIPILKGFLLGFFCLCFIGSN